MAGWPGFEYFGMRLSSRGEGLVTPIYHIEQRRSKIAVFIVLSACDALWREATAGAVVTSLAG